MLSKDVIGLSGMIEPARHRFQRLYRGAFLCEQTAIWRRFPEGWRRARVGVDLVDALHAAATASPAVIIVDSLWYGSAIAYLALK